MHIRDEHVDPGHVLIKDLNSRNDSAAFILLGIYSRHVGRNTGMNARHM